MCHHIGSFDPHPSDNPIRPTIRKEGGYWVVRFPRPRAGELFIMLNRISMDWEWAIKAVDEYYRRIKNG